MNRKQLAKMMDHTILKATATPAQVEQICREALEIGAASVCINPCNIEQARRLLDGSGVRVCTVIGFPLGANTPEVKAFETQDAIRRGAEEVDMVINVGALLAGDDETVYRDIKAVVDAAAGTLTKVIIETCYLSDDQKKTACELAMRAGADFVKTSTGFGTGGATLPDVLLFREHIGPRVKIKASGGIRTEADLRLFLENGCDRLGASAAVTALGD